MERIVAWHHVARSVVVVSAFAAFLTLGGTAIVLFVLDWRLALATLSVTPALIAATIAFRVVSTRSYRAVRERLAHRTPLVLGTSDDPSRATASRSASAVALKAASARW